MRRWGILIGGWILLGLAAVVPAGADGTIILSSVGDFQNAILNDYVRGVVAGQPDASNQALQNAYPGQAKTRSTVLTSDGTNGSPNGLVTEGQTPDANTEYVTSWTYDYHIDPDLTKSTLDLKLFLPKVSTQHTQSGINMVTVTLTSQAPGTSDYFSRTWGFDNTLENGLLSPDTNNLQHFRWELAAGSGADGSNYFNQDSGFDLRYVYFVNVGYRGLIGNSYPLTPDNKSALWTGTESLLVTVTPEPNVSALILSGLLAACLVSARSFQRGVFRRRAATQGL